MAWVATVWNWEGVTLENSQVLGLIKNLRQRPEVQDEYIIQSVESVAGG
jgi:hypothetical protein